MGVMLYVSLEEKFPFLKLSLRFVSYLLPHEKLCTKTNKKVRAGRAYVCYGLKG